MAYMAQEGAYDKDKSCEFPNSEKYGKKASKSRKIKKNNIKSKRIEVS